jgi:ubiquitin carboxyl-terminal hydrolase 5/13
MEDLDIDAPLGLGGASGADDGARGVNPESIGMMAAMGIGAPQARKALKETGGNIERAVEWVFSHPEDQGDFGDDDAPMVAPAAEGEKAMAGNAELPATFRLQSIVCHKGASIHAR